MGDGPVEGSRYRGNVLDIHGEHIVLGGKTFIKEHFSVFVLGYHGSHFGMPYGDYWVRALRYIIVLSLCIFQFVKRGAYDVKALYDPHGIYRYSNGLNWRALLTLVLTVTPNLVRLRVRIISAVSCCSQPGLINAVNPDIYIGNISWYYAPGFITGCKPVFFLFV